MIFLLRWSLDDSVDAVVVAAVAALNALLVNQADEVGIVCSVIFLLRWSLDDSVDAVVVAAVAALNALLVNQADEVGIVVV